MQRPKQPTPQLLLLLQMLLLALLLQTSTAALFTSTNSTSTSLSRATGPPAPNELFAVDANASALTPCADHKTCDECVEASYTCHFCEFDFQCHAIGSPMGCVTGISTCHHLDGSACGLVAVAGYNVYDTLVLILIWLQRGRLQAPGAAVRWLRPAPVRGDRGALLGGDADVLHLWHCVDLLGIPTTQEAVRARTSATSERYCGCKEEEERCANVRFIFI